MSERLPATLLAAVLDLVAAEGLDAVTVRRVATRAEVSIGAVQYHFPTKDALLLGAMEATSAAVLDRVRAGGHEDPAATLRHLAAELVPLDEQRRTEGRVWLAFVARAAVDPTLRAVHARDWQELEDALSALLAAHRQGDRPDDDQPDDDRGDARLLLAVLDGLAVGGLVEPDRLAPAHVRAVLDRVLDDLL